jgi:hypothetical protein
LGQSVWGVCVGSGAHIVGTMPVPMITRVQDPEVLLARATAGLFPAAPRGDSPWPTLNAWVVLRQGGLRDDLHRLAASQGVAGWFDAPICLFNELADRWGPAEPQAALSEPERHALLARLLDEHGAGLIPRGSSDAWVPTVDRFIGELIGEDVGVEAFAEAALRAADDTFATRRAERLAAVYGAWQGALAAAGRRDGRDARVRLARAIGADPQGFAERLGGRREVRIVGLADLRGGWRLLFEALAASPVLDRVEILTSASLEIPGATVREDSGRVADAGATTVAAGARPDSPADTTSSSPRVRFIQAADSAREMERVAVEVRALLDAGVAPTRIAVVAREARPSIDAMAAALGALGVPVTARRRTGLAHTAPARALLAILGVLRDSWSRHAVAELAEHPLLVTGLDAGIVNTLGFSRAMSSREAWSEGLAELLARVDRRELGTDDGDDRRAALPPRARVQATLDAWHVVAPRLAALEGARTLDAWCAWCVEALDDGAWGIGARLGESCGDDAVWFRELRARDRIRALLVAWQEAAVAFGGREQTLDATRFVDRLLLILAQDLITMPETDAGVVVAEALAAAWRAFDHLFVVGMSAGSFPKRPADGVLMDADEREALRAAGLPLDASDAWRARERALFDVLCAAPRESLTLSWPALDGDGRETARSAFVDVLLPRGVLQEDAPEEVVIAGFPVARDAAAIAHARVVAAREADRAGLSPWNGAIEDAELLDWLASHYGESYVWSASQLETVAKCPWHWFAARLLGLEDRRDADDLLEPTVKGSLRHDALDRFFARARAERGTPVVLGPADALWVPAEIAVALREAWDAAAAAGVWLGPPALHATQREELLASLEGYLKFEMKFNDDYRKGNTNASKVIRSGAIEGEYAFDNVALEGDGVRFRLRGMVDRIDQGVDDRILNAERYLAAIDYKSSKGSTPGGGEKEAWEDGIVLQVPLYAKALQERFGDSGRVVARMEYRTIGSRPERVHALSLAPMEGGELATGEALAAAEAQLAGALDAAGRRVRAVRAGELPTFPAPSAGCPPFCPARDICRIPGGPRE